MTRALRSTWKRLLGALAGSREEAALADEFETHIQMQTEDNLRLGMPPEEARRAAILKFGGIETIKESYRDRRGIPVLAALRQDVPYALRCLRQNPGFTVAAILSLALGIGITSAIFAVASEVLLRELPYPEPKRLATVSLGGAISAPWFDAFRQEARSLEHGALFTTWYFNLSSGGEPERIPAARVSSSLFKLLGISPQLGRVFTADEDRQGQENVVVLGDHIWKRRFGGDPNILGKTLLLNGIPHTVIGVMPPGFRFPEGPEHHATVGPFPPAEMWRPMALVDWERTCKGCFNFAMLARLRAGAGTKDATAELAEILKRHGASQKVQDSVEVLNLQDAIVGKVRRPLLVLFGAVVLALLIACVNVANLLLARSLSRRGEMAIRLSIGATPARLTQQVLTEAVTLGVCAGAAGVLVAVAAVRGLVMLAPAEMPRIGTASVDWRVFAFAFSLALFTAVISGAAPALVAARNSPGEVMKAGTQRVTAAPSRMRAALVVAQVTLSLVLLVGSGLFAVSFFKVLQVQLGFQPGRVLTMRLSLPETHYDDRRREAFVEQLVAYCSDLPGVTAAAVTSTLPLTGEAEGWGIVAENSPRPDDWVTARVRGVTPGYFRTLGIPLLAGRDFDDRDRDTNRVAIVSESLARRLWPGVTDPLGRRLAGNRPATIVGIAGDTRASGIDSDVRPYLYVPFTQFTPPEFSLAVRTLAEPAALAEAVKAQIRRLDADQPVTHVASMEQIVSSAVAPRRFPAVLMTAFAAFALTLTAVGIFGVLSYSVAQRTHEIGIRMALGATQKNVVTDVLRQAGLMVSLGTSLGLMVALQSVPLLRGFLYGVAAIETSIIVACAVVLAIVAVGASIVPAWRAATLDPLKCLRYE
jgi:putative ABC transport system permease protein